MKRMFAALFLFAIIASQLVVTVHAEDPTPTVTPTLVSATTEINPDVIVGGITYNFLLTLLITLVAGAIGGIVYELLLLQGNIEKPHQPTEQEAEKYPYAIFAYLFDLGIYARIIVGALAAVAATLAFTPSTPLSLLATGVIAGSAGVSIFRSMQDRLLAALAQKDALNAQNNATEQNNMVEEALVEVTELKNSLQSASSSTVANSLITSGTPGVSIPLSQEKLDKVERLLIEAKGIFKRSK